MPGHFPSLPASWVAISVWLATTAGCSGGSASPQDAGAAEVELGTGTAQFATLPPESRLGLVAGVQGGYHFVVHARVRGLLTGDPEQPGELDNPSTVFAVYLENGEQVDAMGPPLRLGYVGGDDGFYELPSGRIVVLSDDQVAAGLIPAIYGQRVRLAVEVVDSAGVSVSASTWIVAEPTATAR